MNKQTKWFNITMAIVTFTLAVTITLQYRTMTQNTSIVQQTFADAELKDELLRSKESYDIMSEMLAQSTNSLEKVRKDATADTDSSQELGEKLKKNNMLLGLTNVEGEGLTITVKDGDANIQMADISSYLVHDSDLRELISELSNAGAEAIEINNERIVNSTSITCAGNVISINGIRVSSPFIIKAIGNQSLMYGALTRPGSYVQLLSSQNIPTTIKKESNIQIAKYTGVISSEYLNTIKESEEK